MTDGGAEIASDEAIGHDIVDEGQVAQGSVSIVRESDARREEHCGDRTPPVRALRRVLSAERASTSSAAGKPVDATLKRRMRERFAKHDRRASRYWELIAIMNGTQPPDGNVEDGRFVQVAVAHHLAKE
jgi:hypothetical protein